MDFKDYIKQIPERAGADKLKLLNTEEATKNARPDALRSGKYRWPISSQTKRTIYRITQ